MSRIESDLAPIRRVISFRVTFFPFKSWSRSIYSRPFRLHELGFSYSHLAHATSFPTDHIEWIRAWVNSPWYYVSVDGVHLQLFFRRQKRRSTRRSALPVYILILAMEVSTQLLDSWAEEGWLGYHPECRVPIGSHSCELCGWYPHLYGLFYRLPRDCCWGFFWGNFTVFRVSGSAPKKTSNFFIACITDDHSIQVALLSYNFKWKQNKSIMHS